MLIPFGILSSAAGVEVGDYELIASEILTTNEASITFSNLGDYSATYKHLQVRATARGTNAAAGIVLRMILNGDTANNYSQHGLQGDGSAVTSFANANQPFLFASAITAAGATANSFSGMVIDLLDAYSTTKNTTMRSLSGSTAFNRILLFSSAYLNTASITTIRFECSGDSIATGSRFSLYGIKG
jgi:hypothetical protein